MPIKLQLAQLLVSWSVSLHKDRDEFNLLNEKVTNWGQTHRAQWEGKRVLPEERSTQSLTSPEKEVLIGKCSFFHWGNYWNLEVFPFPGERDKPHFTEEEMKKMSIPYMTKCTTGRINSTIGCSRPVTVESNRLSFADLAWQHCQGARNASRQIPDLPPGLLKISRWIHLYMH